MPSVALIFKVKPEKQKLLHVIDYSLGFFEKFAQLQNIQMQFELIDDSILVFFKTLSDFKRIFQMLSEITLDTNSDFIPAEKLVPWECSIQKIDLADRNIFLMEFAEVVRKFLGRFGRIDVIGEKILIYLPENFYLDKFFKTANLVNH